METASSVVAGAFAAGEVTSPEHAARNMAPAIMVKRAATVRAFVGVSISVSSRACARSWVVDWPELVVLTRPSIATAHPVAAWRTLLKQCWYHSTLSDRLSSKCLGNSH